MTKTQTLQEHWTQKEQKLVIDWSYWQARAGSDQPEREWQQQVPDALRRMTELLKTSISDCRFLLLARWEFRPGTWVASRSLIQWFLSLLEVEILIPDADRSANCWQITGQGAASLRLVPVQGPLDLTKVRKDHAIVRISKQDTSFPPIFFYTDSAGKGMEYTRGYNSYFDHSNGKRFEAGDLLLAACAKKLAAFRPALASVETLTKNYLELRNNRQYALWCQEQLQKLATSKKLWEKVHLPDSQVLDLLVQAEMFERNDPAAPRGLLLSGEPGTGKTLLAKTLAKTVGCSFHSVTLADLKASIIGGSSQNVRALWQKARASQPAIVFIDECEGVFGSRSGVETDSFAQDLVQTFLSEWDGMAGSSRVWVIGATNKADRIDGAILSRFGQHMVIVLPDAKARMRILKQECSAMNIHCAVPGEMEDQTQGMSGRDLHQLAKRVRTLAHPREPGREHFLEATTAFRGRPSTPVDERASWDTLILNDNTKAELQLTCNLLRDAEAWQARGVSVPRGILLTGPPGTGKTQVARTLANEGGLTFIAATTADVKGKWLGHSGAQMKQLFERARSSAPSILFFDELDIIAKHRGGSSSDSFTDEMVGQLLQELDGTKSHTQHVFVLGATNHLENVDPAVLSRFPQKIAIPRPDRNARARILAVLIQGKPVAFTLEEGCLELATWCEGLHWSGRDLRSWVETAEHKAVQDAQRRGGPQHFIIDLSHFALPCIQQA